MNLSRITVDQLSTDEKMGLIQDGLLNDAAKIGTFPSADSLIFIKYLQLDSITPIKSLDEKFKKSGHTNFNFLAYINVSKMSFQNAINTIIYYPRAYNNGIKKAFLLYFDSPTKFNLVEQNIYKIKKYNRFFDAFIYGTSPTKNSGYLSLICIPLMLLLGIALLFKRTIHSKIKVVLFFLLFNVIYVMVIGNFFELGENNRFRYYTEIFNFIIWAIIISSMFNKKELSN